MGDSPYRLCLCLREAPRNLHKVHMHEVYMHVVYMCVGASLVR